VLKNNLKTLTFVNLIVILLIIGFLLFDKIYTNEKIVYVDNQKLFDNFQMTKDLKKMGELEFNSKKKEIDSLYIKIQGNLNESEKENLMKLLISKREEFDDFNQTYASSEAMKIWNRIDSYVVKFSEEKKYKIIIGANSKRDVLYVDKKIDVTQELTEYINKKYEGFK
jgi:outer membrane protein